VPVYFPTAGAGSSRLLIRWGLNTAHLQSRRISWQTEPNQPSFRHDLLHDSIAAGCDSVAGFIFLTSAWRKPAAATANLSGKI
jgi:hypothetical protein